MLPKVAILIPSSMAERTISGKDMDRLSSFANVSKRAFEEADLPSAAQELILGADACITGWGSCQITEDMLNLAPGLKIIVHAAGSIKPIVSDAVWERGIKVTSAANAIAVGVAEHTLGLMLSAMKRCYWLNDITHKGGWKDEAEIGRITEIYGITVGVVGAGHVGRHFIKLLQMFDVTVLVHDPFLSADDADRMGAVKVDRLEDLVSRVDVLSLNAPSLPETHHIINSRTLPMLKDGAILINTARGSLIDEEALFNELKTGRITACLDVTDPEPPAADHPLRSLPNVILTPHIAGAVANNTFRLGKWAITELERFFTSRDLLFPVRREDLARIA